MHCAIDLLHVYCIDIQLKWCMAPSLAPSTLSTWKAHHAKKQIHKKSNQQFLHCSVWAPIIDVLRVIPSAHISILECWTINLCLTSTVAKALLEMIRQREGSQVKRSTAHPWKAVGRVFSFLHKRWWKRKKWELGCMLCCVGLQRPVGFPDASLVVRPAIWAQLVV